MAFLRRLLVDDYAMEARAAVQQSKDPMLVSYDWLLPFERSFDEDWATTWYQQNWTLSISLSLVYVCVIFILRQYMSTRQRFQLKQPLIVWNALLAAFSILGVVRMFPELAASVRQGVDYSFCNNSYTRGVPYCWCWLFGLSKVVELGDTLFIVLRKQPLIFLHWYHHITVMIYTWFSVGQHTASGRWFITINLIVHSLMYSYYCARACGWRLPGWVPFSITLLQLAQMVLGCVINVYSWWVKTQTGGRCDQSLTNINAALAIYGSYFVLFGHFFYVNYYTKRGKFVQQQQRQKLVDSGGGDTNNNHKLQHNGKLD